MYLCITRLNLGPSGWAVPRLVCNINKSTKNSARGFKNTNLKLCFKISEERK